MMKRIVPAHRQTHRVLRLLFCLIPLLWWTSNVSATTHTTDTQRNDAGHQAKGVDSLTLDDFMSFVTRKGLTSTSYQNQNDVAKKRQRSFSGPVKSTSSTPTATLFCWIEQLRGASNVFCASEADNFQAEPQTSYTGDTGYSVETLSEYENSNVLILNVFIFVIIFIIKILSIFV